MIKYIFTYIVLLISTVMFATEVESNKLIDKAYKHIENREWKEASALYNIIISQNSQKLSYYAPAIVAAAKANNYDLVVDIVVTSEKNGIALDSLLNSTLSFATKIGDTSIYEKTVLSMRESQPWFEKLFNKHLLDYYTKRHYNQKAIDIANRIIEERGANIKETMFVKAKCLNEMGKIDSAVVVMENILKIDSTFTEARLYLGNYKYLMAIDLIENSTEEIDEKRICNLLQEAKHFLDIEPIKTESPYIRERLKDIDALCQPKTEK